MYPKVVDRLFEINLFVLDIKLKFFGILYLKNETTNSKKHIFQYKLWQFWSTSFIVVVGIYSVMEYSKILSNTLMSDDGYDIIENVLLFIEICTFIVAISVFYAKTFLKRKEILKLFHKSVHLYRDYNFSSKASSRRSLIYFLIIKTFSSILSCFSVIFVISKYFIIFKNDYICKILLFYFLFSIYCVVCNVFYATNLFFVHVNQSLFFMLEHSIKFNLYREMSEEELTKIVQVHEKFMDIQRQTFKFFEPFIFFSINHLTFGIIAEMAQVYFAAWHENDFKAQIVNGFTLLAFFLTQLYGHCHGIELLTKSVS